MLVVRFSGNWTPLLLLGLLACSGCVDGPFGGLARMNPYIRKKWEQDEQYGPTFHRRLADLQGVRSAAPGLDPQKKEQIAADIAQTFVAETNPVLRAEMIAILGELRTGSTISALRGAISDADEDVRIAACRAWGKFPAAEALPVLTEIMQQETDVDVRLAAITELGRFPDQTAVALLGQALDDNDPAIQHLAVQSLKTSTGRNYGDSVPAWRDYVQGREPQPPSSPSLVERVTSWF